ncbi:GDYXXLXY protein [Leptospira gomenensis]|uniref:GDYXXLXY protein n=1 Tax=Leptospira gomenensis TaxID=2484974 RepID=A0A5F1Z1K6_9LEPT|nr:GDYXXLXY domain-containing protein [Leptospira gomenensis]TGK35468.1 GDYXXLXY protein [Leptospira gomenensis]TGK40640.1 GDYXXLXY protein [Leptospira gomenensis]TGK46318.1 GDYXXLXY protein [Leptospira gomenensis]TGK66453.1 GDYXXLXY protein [Leptospira gomenensis]
MKALHRVLLLAFLIPIGFFSAEIVYLETFKNQGKDLILPITGYDPRDLLAGHYLRYNIVFQSDALCKEDATGEGLKTSKEREHCVCYPRSGKIFENDGYFVPDCNEDFLKNRSLCRVHLRGKCVYGRFTIGNERYYVNEERAKEYEDRLRKENVHIRLKVDPQGKALTDVLIWEDGSSL